MPIRVSFVLRLLLSPAEFLGAASNLSSFTATGPDKVAYPMLKHLLRPGTDFLLHIFNLFWIYIPFLPSGRHLLIFPSTRWESLSTLLHPSGLSLSPPACQSFLNASYYPVICIILLFLESNSILSPRQAGIFPGLSTLDQILYLSQSISDGLKRPGSWTILSTIDFLKVFDSVWHPVLFNKLILAGLPSCFAQWAQSFLSDRRACVVFQDDKNRSFRVRRDVLQGSVFGPVLFSLFINDLSASLPSSVSCSLYPYTLVTWYSSPSVSTALEATQGAMFRLERWSEYWCLHLNPRRCEACFFSDDSLQANLQPNLFLLNSRLRFNPTPTFLGVTFDRTISFSKHVSLL